MAADKEQKENDDLNAPGALVEELKRLDGRMILMTERDDEAVLSRPRLHLRRIKQMRKDRGEHVAIAQEDLALAARLKARPLEEAADFREKRLGQVERLRWWRLPALAAAVILGVVGLTLQVRPHTGNTPSGRGFQTPESIMPAFILIGASLVLFAIWIVTRPRR